MDDVRIALDIDGGGAGSIGPLPLIIDTMDAPSPDPGGKPVPWIPAPGPPGSCGVESSGPVLITVGIREGCINLAGGMPGCAVDAPQLRGAGASGSGARRPRLIGVETERADGSPTVFSIGNRSSKPITSASSPN